MTVRIEFPLPAPPASMNEPDGRERGRKRQAWHSATFWRTIEAFPAVGPTGRSQPPSDVLVRLPIPADGRRRDPINYALTVKWIVDALVKAGLWPDDTPEFVSQHVPTLVEGAEHVVVDVIARNLKGTS